MFTSVYWFQYYRVSGLCTLSISWMGKKHFRNWMSHVLRLNHRDAPVQLGLLWVPYITKIHKPKNPKCNVWLVEPFRIEHRWTKSVEIQILIQIKILNKASQFKSWLATTREWPHTIPSARKYLTRSLAYIPYLSSSKKKKTKKSCVQNWSIICE
jgi:hypothetical protein